jgi:hypothetical protein
VAHSRGGWQCLLVLVGGLVAIAASGCGAGDIPRSPPGEVTVPVGALAAAGVDRSNTARAAYYLNEVTRYRDIATHERQLSTAYAQRTPPTAATKDWNATLKARADARAIAADQIATDIQTLVDFHTARAAAEVAQ